MKKLIGAGLLSLFASAVIAGDFDRTTTETTFSRQNLEFSVETFNDEVDSLAAGIYVLPHMFGADTIGMVYSEARVNVRTDDLELSTEYQLNVNLYSDLRLYGEFELEYVNDLNNRNPDFWNFAPRLGIQYYVNYDFSVFTETGYEFALNENRRNAGGFVEVGFEYAVLETAAIRPSLIQRYDTVGSDDLEARLELKFAF